MNYYPHHIGDFIRDTSNLNDHQLATYMRMIWAYYLSEQPYADAPEDIAFAMRSDSTTVALLLRHYFEKREDGWHHKRCDKVIEDFHTKGEKRREAANARWSNANALQKKSNSKENHANQEPITNNQVNTDTSAGKLPTCPTQEIIDLYNRTLPELPAVKLMSEKRKKAASQFWKFVLTSKRTDGQPRATDRESALVWIENYFGRTRDNNFLMGPNPNGWTADFDFLLTEKGKTHVIEKTRIKND